MMQLKSNENNGSPDAGVMTLHLICICIRTDLNMETLQINNF